MYFFFNLNLFFLKIGIIQGVLDLVDSDTVGDGLRIVLQRLLICTGEKSVHVPI
jgi:hypothetical protein